MKWSRKSEVELMDKLRRYLQLTETLFFICSSSLTLTIILERELGKTGDKQPLRTARLAAKYASDAASASATTVIGRTDATRIEVQVPSVRTIRVRRSRPIVAVRPAIAERAVVVVAGEQEVIRRGL